MAVLPVQFRKLGAAFWKDEHSFDMGKIKGLEESVKLVEDMQKRNPRNKYRLKVSQDGNVVYVSF